MTTTQPSATATPRPRRPPWFMPGTLVRRPLRIVERNAIVYRRGWLVFLSGLVEPFLYLLSIGIGVGALVGKVPGPNGVPVEYDAFVAPGLMAAAAMNGAVLDTTFNFFIKLKYSHTYDAMLATPLGVRDVAIGEVLSALLRGAFYSTVFLIAMVAFGLVASWWAVLAVPAATPIAFAFAGAGLGLTTFMRSWVDFDYVNLALGADVPVLGHFLPAVAVPGRAAGGGEGHAALSGCRAAPRPYSRRRLVDDAAQRAVPRGTWACSACASANRNASPASCSPNHVTTNLSGSRPSSRPSTMHTVAARITHLPRGSPFLIATPRGPSPPARAPAGSRRSPCPRRRRPAPRALSGRDALRRRSGGRRLEATGVPRRCRRRGRSRRPRSPRPSSGAPSATPDAMRSVGAPSASTPDVPTCFTWLT